jgi:hypothetical protein
VNGPLPRRAGVALVELDRACRAVPNHAGPCRAETDPTLPGDAKPRPVRILPDRQVEVVTVIGTRLRWAWPVGVEARQNLRWPLRGWKVRDLYHELSA